METQDYPVPVNLMSVVLLTALAVGLVQPPTNPVSKPAGRVGVWPKLPGLVPAPKSATAELTAAKNNVVAMPAAKAAVRTIGYAATSAAAELVRLAAPSNVTSEEAVDMAYEGGVQAVKTAVGASVAFNLLVSGPVSQSSE